MHAHLHASAWPGRSIPEAKTRLRKALLMGFQILVASIPVRSAAMESVVDLGFVESLQTTLSRAQVFAIESRLPWQPEQMD